MIIQRKYEWLGILYTYDEKSKEVIDRAFKNGKLSRAEKKKLLEYNHCNTLDFLNIGCGIPSDIYKDFMEKLEELDATDPYDNGLTFNDVTDIEYESSRKGTALQMRFIIQNSDIRYRIVGFAAIENSNGEMQINKGWKMKDPFTIG